MLGLLECQSSVAGRCAARRRSVLFCCLGSLLLLLLHSSAPPFAARLRDSLDIAWPPARPLDGLVVRVGETLCVELLEEVVGMMSNGSGLEKPTWLNVEA